MYVSMMFVEFQVMKCSAVVELLSFATVSKCIEFANNLKLLWLLL